MQVALTDYLNSASVHYWYQLRGGSDTAWYALPTSRTLTLSQLPAGDYTLRLRAESSSGLRAANELALPAHVAHTWWKSRPL
jgi:hypothetical protein